MGANQSESPQALSRPVVWLPEAETELNEAVSWYWNVRPELGARFVQAVDETIEMIAANPLLYAVVDKKRRRAGVHRFPYGIFYLVEPKRIVVMACFTASASPPLEVTKTILTLASLRRLRLTFRPSSGNFPQ